MFLLILVLLAVAGFFSAAETAVTFASKAKIHQLTKNGSSRAKIIQILQQNLGLLISAILTLNTMINAAIVSLGTSIIFGWFTENNPYVAVLAPILMGVIVLLYAEIIPKMLAIQNPTTFLLKVSLFLNFVYNLFKPFNSLLNRLASLTLRMFGIHVIGGESKYAGGLDELRGAIDLHRGPGDAIHERAMLKSILDLASVQVSEIMIHRQNVTMLNASNSIDQLLEQALECPYTRIPIWQDNLDNIVGVVHTKDLIRATYNRRNNKQLNILDIASKPWFIPESTSLLDQLNAFRQRREHFALVVDEYGVLMGIVTLEDVLEEIVGDITDEHDITVRGVKSLDDGSYIVYGNVTIRDLNRQFDWDLPDEPASTVAGLLLHHLRIIPNVGQVFNLLGFRFEILRRQVNHVTLVKIKPILDIEK